MELSVINTYPCAYKKICLKNTLKILPELASSLAQSSDPIFQLISVNLNDESIPQCIREIARIIEEDIAFSRNTLYMQTQQCFAVKPGINGLLDVARRQYSDLVEGSKNASD